MSVTHMYRYACCEMGFFFNIFINQFLEIHRSVYTNNRIWFNKHKLSGIEKKKHEIGLQACKFLKKGLQHRCFPVEFAKISRTVVVASENMEHIFM